jgi:ethanolamine utilization protein EutL
MNITLLRPRILSCRQIEQLDVSLVRALGLDTTRFISFGLVTCDQDDSLYAALDDATKQAKVEVVYAKSFYAGSQHASGPTSGEVLGILAGMNPAEVSEGLWAVREALNNQFHFASFEGPLAPAFFAHVIGETGRYLSSRAGIPIGAPLGYFIATPTEALVGLDAALKAAPVAIAQFFGPPTETNFAGAYLTGTQANLEAAKAAFVNALGEVAASPLFGLKRPERERR